MTLSWRHALSVWRRNATMYRRTWSWNILPNFFEPVLYLVSIGVGLGAYITTMGGTSYIEFLAPGLVCVAAMNGASFDDLSVIIGVLGDIAGVAAALQQSL